MMTVHHRSIWLNLQQPRLSGFERIDECCGRQFVIMIAARRRVSGAEVGGGSPRIEAIMRRGFACCQTWISCRDLFKIHHPHRLAVSLGPLIPAKQPLLLGWRQRCADGQ